MTTTTAVADGHNEVERQAATDANAVQCGVNLVAIVGAWHRNLLAMHRAGICGDQLNNHPVNLAFVSKLNQPVPHDDRAGSGCPLFHRSDRDKARLSNSKSSRFDGHPA